MGLVRTFRAWGMMDVNSQADGLWAGVKARLWRWVKEESLVGAPKHRGKIPLPRRIESGSRKTGAIKTKIQSITL